LFCHVSSFTMLVLSENSPWVAHNPVHSHLVRGAASLLAAELFVET
jgi:hypothetical protein